MGYKHLPKVGPKQVVRASRRRYQNLLLFLIGRDAQMKFDRLPPPHWNSVTQSQEPLQEKKLGATFLKAILVMQRLQALAMQAR